jgi:TetR/AcrR family transcriptional regulator, transcriptional repressor for nem operon
MRYQADRKEKTRDRVLQAAAKAIRAEGPHQMAVAAVMAKAGLTVGGFYAHFESKDDLVAAAIDQMFAEGRRRKEDSVRPAAETLAVDIDAYLSAAHRDSREIGCPLSFLAADMPRQSERARERFAAGAAAVRGRIARKLAAMGVDDPDAAASSLLSELVGALSLARAEPDPAASDAILERSKTALKRRFGLESRLAA